MKSFGSGDAWFKFCPSHLLALLCEPTYLTALKTQFYNIKASLASPGLGPKAYSKVSLVCRKNPVSDHLLRPTTLLQNPICVSTCASQLT